MKPRTIKEAFDMDFIAIRIYAKESKRIRVTLRPRFYIPGTVGYVDFWIGRDYFKRKYPNVYNKL